MTNERDFHEEWLSAYLDGELSDEQVRVVRKRLENDPAACRMLQDLKEVRRMIACLPDWSGKLPKFKINPTQAPNPEDTDPLFSTPVQSSNIFENTAPIILDPLTSIGSGKTLTSTSAAQPQSSLPANADNQVVAEQSAEVSDEFTARLPTKEVSAREIFVDGSSSTQRFREDPADPVAAAQEPDEQEFAEQDPPEQRTGKSATEEPISAEPVASGYSAPTYSALGTVAPVPVVEEQLSAEQLTVEHTESVAVEPQKAEATEPIAIEQVSEGQLQAEDSVAEQVAERVELIGDQTHGQTESHILDQSRPELAARESSELVSESSIDAEPDGAAQHVDSTQSGTDGEPGVEAHPIQPLNQSDNAEQAQPPVNAEATSQKLTFDSSAISAPPPSLVEHSQERNRSQSSAERFKVQSSRAHDQRLYSRYRALRWLATTLATAACIVLAFNLFWLVEFPAAILSWRVSKPDPTINSPATAEQPSTTIGDLSDRNLERAAGMGAQTELLAAPGPGPGPGTAPKNVTLEMKLRGAEIAEGAAGMASAEVQTQDFQEAAQAERTEFPSPGTSNAMSQTETLHELAALNESPEPKAMRLRSADQAGQDVQAPTEPPVPSLAMSGMPAAPTQKLDSAKPQAIASQNEIRPQDEIRLDDNEKKNGGGMLDAKSRSAQPPIPTEITLAVDFPLELTVLRSRSWTDVEIPSVFQEVVRYLVSGELVAANASSNVQGGYSIALLTLESSSTNFDANLQKRLNQKQLFQIATTRARDVNNRPAIAFGAIIMMINREQAELIMRELADAAQKESLTPLWIVPTGKRESTPTRTDHVVLVLRKS